jgi:hypothetical protein
MNFQTSNEARKVWFQTFNGIYNIIMRYKKVGDVEILLLYFVTLTNFWPHQNHQDQKKSRTRWASSTAASKALNTRCASIQQHQRP